MFEGAPPDWNILTRILISLLGTAALLVFLAGLRASIKKADNSYGMIAASIAFLKRSKA